MGFGYWSGLFVFYGKPLFLGVHKRNTMKRYLMLAIVVMWLFAFGLLVYSLVYADADSPMRSFGIVVGLVLLLLTQIFRRFFASPDKANSNTAQR